MSKTKLIFVIATSLFILGCSKAPEPVKLDNNSAITINQELIRKHNFNVPKDPFLKNNNWTYNINLIKNEKELISNDMIVKTFLVAHNADKIIVVGNENVINDYVTYFKQNGVTANIETSKVDMIDGKKNMVNVLFFHEKKD